MTRDTPRVGVLGAGAMAETHLAALHRIGAPAAVYSPSGRAAGLAERFGAACYHEPGELIAAVDVVDICSPTDTHLPLSLRAYEAGRAVICEKPLARTAEDARAVIAAARSSARPLYVAHVVRYFAAYAAVRQAVAGGRLGEVRELHLRRTGASPTSAWFHDEPRSGGVLMDQLIHDFDFARWTLGEVTEVSATLRSERVAAGTPPVTRASATLTHAGGAVSRLTGGWLDQGEPFTTELQAVGGAGTLRHGNLDGILRLDSAAGESALPLPDHEKPYDAQLAEFLAHLAGGPEPRISAEDALAALELTLAAIESAHTGRPVRMR